MKLRGAVFGSRGGPAVDADAADWRQALPGRSRADLARVSKVRSYATVSLVSLDRRSEHLKEILVWHQRLLWLNFDILTLVQVRCRDGHG